MKAQVDPEDLLAFPFFILGSLVGLGLMDGFEILGWNPADVALSLPAGTDITWAGILAIISFTVVVATNEFPTERGERAWTAITIYLIVATYALLLAPPFMPLFEWVLGTGSGGVAAWVAIVIQSSGYTAVSFSG